MIRRISVCLVALAFTSLPLVYSSVEETFTETPSITEQRLEDQKTYVVGRVLIDAPPQDVWRVLTDYKHATDLFTNLRACEVLEERGSTKMIKQTLKPIGPINFQYVVELKEDEPSHIEWKRKSGSLKDFNGSWNLFAEGENKTRVKYEVYADGGILLPAWAMRMQLKGYMPEVLGLVKKASEKKS
jgi:carbon monoxide dehydrogenase subunit G